MLKGDKKGKPLALKKCKTCGKMVKYMNKHIKSHAARKYCYPCKKMVKYWDSHIASKTHKKFASNPISLYCELCDWTAPGLWEAYQHPKKYTHQRLDKMRKIKESDLGIKVYECPNFCEEAAYPCKYRGYQRKLYMDHFTKCQKRQWAAAAAIDSSRSESIETCREAKRGYRSHAHASFRSGEAPPVTKADHLMSSIMKVLDKLRKKGIDPNDHFNYGFYAEALISCRSRWHKPLYLESFLEELLSICS